MKDTIKVLALTVVSSAFLMAACGGGGGSAGTAGTNTQTNTTTDATTETGSNTGATASPDEAVSVVIGSGNKIETTAKDIKYRYRYAVTVRNAKGLPVKGAEVTVDAQPVNFSKGMWNYATAQAGGQDTSKRERSLAVTCPAEDVNNNNVLDAGEDVNGDGILTPEKAQIVTVIENGQNITDNQGIVYVIAEYNKSHASWFQYKLVANAKVTGTEGTASRVADTYFVEGDQNDPSIPFRVSPYGTSANCNDIL